MPTCQISVLKVSLNKGELHRLAAGHHAVYVEDGEVDISMETTRVGEGAYAETGVITPDNNVSCILFSVLRAERGVDGNALLFEHFDSDAGEAVLRLDQINFPPGACAYRHTHPGPGIRYLVEGELEIVSDQHRQVMATGSAWFEDANSPVRATAGAAPASFVRAMVLPIDFLGKPTLNILSPEDATKPRLQTNKRFFDQVIRL